MDKQSPTLKELKVGQEGQRHECNSSKMGKICTQYFKVRGKKVIISV